MAAMTKNIIVILILALSLAGPVWAGSRGQGMGRGMGYGLGTCAHPGLGLSPGQATRLQAVQSEYLKSIRPLQEEMINRKNELRLCESGGNQETEKASQLREQLRERQGQIREIRLRYKMECQAILTPQQLKKIHSDEGGRGARLGPGRSGWGQ